MQGWLTVSMPGACHRLRRRLPHPRARRTPRVESPRAAAEPGREQEPLGRGAGMGAGRREDGE